MSDRLESMLIGTAGLAFAAFVAFYLAFARSAADAEPAARDRLVRLVALAVLVQGAHFAEELATGFERRFPELLGLAAWTTRFFVGFNLFWLAVWAVAVFGVRAGVDAAYFPIWFLGIGMAMNGLVHPMLALMAGGYFPGLVSSPFAGALGVVLLRRLWELTEGRW